MEWKIEENTVRCGIQRVENTLVKSGAFALRGRRKLGGVEPQWEVIVVEVTGSPIERPKKSSVPAARAKRNATR